MAIEGDLEEHNDEEEAPIVDTSLLTIEKHQGKAEKIYTKLV